MTILSAGHEVGSLTPIDAASIEQTSDDYFNSSQDRCSFKVENTASYGRSVSWAAQADFWCALRHIAQPPVSGSGYSVILEFYHNSTVVLFLDTLNTGTTTMDLRVWTLQSGAMALVGSLTASRALNDFDIRFVSNSASGSVEFYSSGALIAEMSGSGLNHAGITGVTSVRHRGRAFGAHHHSRVIYTTEPTIGWIAPPEPPAGAGNYSQWTGAFGDVDETVYTDTDIITAATNGLKSSFTFVHPTANSLLNKGVVVAARAKRGSTGPQNLRAFLRIGGTDYNHATTKSLGVGFDSYTWVWEVSPATSVAFTASEIENLEYGFEAIT